MIKMKIKISTLFFIILLSVSACVYAQADTYIVRFNDSVQMFDSEEDTGINFTVATAEELQEYIDAGIVEDYEPNYEVVAIEPVTEETEETTPTITDNWNYNMINAQFANNLRVMGTDVKVAVIDSGLCSDDMIRSQILNGYDFIENVETDEEVNNDNAEGQYHGTTVSSVIVRKNIGCGTGIAERARIMPLRVLAYDETKQSSMGSLADIIDAIEYATEAKCDVINLSLALVGEGIVEEDLTTLSDAITNAVNEGIIVIAAAGNQGNETYAYPASLPNVISVASVDSDGERSSFSQYNDKVFISAPGGVMNITTMYKVEDGEAYSYNQTVAGTSISAPHVSALAAIAKCISPQINQEEFMKLLENTSEDLGDEGKDVYYGHGLINCEKAIKELIKEKTIYLSPADILNGQVNDYIGRTSVAAIYNNTREPITVSVLYAQYNADKTLISAKINKAATLAGGEYATIPVPCPIGNVRYMVWDSLDNMVPLAPSSFK